MNGFTPGRIPLVSKVSSFPSGQALNGMTVLNAAQGLLAIADATAGSVLSLNVNTGAVSQVVTSTLMSPNATVAPIGIKGLRVRGNNLYFTNTNRNTYASIPVSSNGSPTGQALALSSLASPDDFQFDTVGNADFANNNTVSKATTSNGPVSVYSNSLLVEGATACQFGRVLSDYRTLYTSRNGGIEQYITGTFTNPGKIVALST